MSTSRWPFASLAVLAACASTAGPPAPTPSPAPVAGPPCVGCALPPRDETQLEVRFLGVGGFLLRRGSDAVLTAPLYSNPSLQVTTLGTVAPNQALVDQLTAGLPLDQVKAVLVGHAHYDHLMDVSAVFDKLAPDARIYGNRSMQHILAAFAPDRSPACGGTPAQAVTITRDRVFAFDDEAADVVDRRVCADVIGGPGAWVPIPGARVRVRALCSEHPAQFIGYHFGLGSVDTDQCEPPPSAGNWLEGQTLAYLIDFLDPSGKPAYRVYYQDAPTDAPVGHVPADVLAEKRVDLALLCVGNYDQVADQPGAILRALSPRYAIGGHWESFFQDQTQPIVPLPFMNVDEYAQRGEMVMGTGGELPIVVNGAPTAARHFVPMPGTTFQLPRSTP
jgi:L-ascorbate metabolism protein UlaG (beta-lactamase superfamily)